MTPMALDAIARLAAGRLVGAGATVPVIGAVSTDTRTLSADGVTSMLFVALKGENFDGHDHVAAAEAHGAAAVLVSHEVAGLHIPQVVVADTERALAAWAAGLQRTRATRVAAITGSNGKTSVKALLLAILGEVGGAYATPGNRNNEIGLPLAVIDAPEDARFAVYEMGAGKPGDIKYLTDIVRPDVSVVNNIAPAHLERMGSLLGVADTKAAIYDALPADGVAAINADDAFAPYFAERAHGRRILRFGLEATADVSARDIVQDARGSTFTLATPGGEARVALPLPGRHNIANALSAASLALGLGVPVADIARGLSAASPVSGRLVSTTLASGAVLIDDSYNANPGSLAAAIETLASAGGERWLVLGDMRELGDDAEALHTEGGRQAKAAGIDRLFTLGALAAHAAKAFGANARAFETHDELATALRADLHGGVRVLVKGSRGSAMDRIVTLLKEGPRDVA